ncbi:MAG: peptide deformylase [Candidatus Omnitrophica bacterium]|nr:peptide deformylase [Candidatus Omnitrophota bacterium]
MPGTELKIKVFGDAVLRRKASPVKAVTDDHRLTLSRMARLMYDSGGIGLAAPQVGLAQAMIVVDIGQGLFKCINPVVIKHEGEQALEEGCLSVPGVCIKVKRARKIKVTFTNVDGNLESLEAEGLLACVFQHEIDHLKGKLIVDYASVVKRLQIKRRLSSLTKKARHETVSESETESCKLQL